MHRTHLYTQCACDETIPAETRDGLEVTADNVQAYSILDHAASSLCDNAAGEDDLQRMDNIAAAAGSSHTVQESSVESSAERALTGEEVVTSSLDNKQATEAEARDVEQRVCMPLHLSPKEVSVRRLSRRNNTPTRTIVEYSFNAKSCDIAHSGFLYDGGSAVSDKDSRRLARGDKEEGSEG
ncbi:hypothetical protein BC629DRAFT_1641693 [Irpex lacteus]|nr:hypothetical protein BC629DRAFT_1641693 [Irpex lacteus]